MSDLDQINQSLLDGDHARIWEAIEDANTMRTAGDEAVSNSVKAVENNTHVNASGLSQEVIDREAGDLRQQNLYELLHVDLQNFSIEFGTRITAAVAQHELDINALKQDIAHTNAVIADVDQRLTNSITQETQNRITQYNSLDKRVKNYENMLSDITMDSAQITMDNGEIRFGAWTILSQARQWDLDILRKVQNKFNEIDDSLKDAIDDLTNQIPVTKDVIDAAIEAISNAPIIKEMDEKLGSNIDKISDLYLKQAQESIDRANELIALNQKYADDLDARAKLIEAQVLGEANARVEAVAREAQIRAQQIIDESTERSEEILENVTAINQEIARQAKLASDALAAEALARAAAIEAKAKELLGKIDSETAGRIEAIELLQDGLTQEIQLRKDGDTASLNALNNYKISTDSSLANIQDKLTLVITESSVTANRVVALDARIADVDSKAGLAQSAAATAQQTANTAVEANKATAEQVNAVSASLRTAVNLLIAAYSNPNEKKRKVEGWTYVPNGLTVSDAAKSATTNGNCFTITSPTTANNGWILARNNARTDWDSFPLPLDEGKKYLISLYVKTSVANTMSITLQQRNPDGTFTNLPVLRVANNASTFNTTTALTRVTFYSTQAISAGIIQGRLVIYLNGKGIAGSVATVERIMVEEMLLNPKEASPWVPGPEDPTLAGEFMDATAAAASSLKTQVDKNTDGVRVLGESMTVVQSDLVDTKNKVALHASAIATMTTDIQTNKDNITQVSSAQTLLTNRMNTAEGKITANTTAISGIETRVSKAEGTLTTTVQDVTLLKADVKSNADGLVATNSALDATKILVNQNKDGLTALTQRTVTLENNVTSLKNDMKNVATTTALEELKGTVTVIDGKVTANTNKLVLLEANIGTVDGKANNAISSAATAQQTATTAANAAKAAAAATTDLGVALSNNIGTNLMKAQYSEPYSKLANGTDGPYTFGRASAITMVDSELRTSGKAYKMTATASSNSSGSNIFKYFGVFQAANWKDAPIRIEDGKQYTISFFAKAATGTVPVWVAMRAYDDTGTYGANISSYVLGSNPETMMAQVTSDKYNRYTFYVKGIDLKKTLRTADLLVRFGAGVTVGTAVFIDQIMVEERIGATPKPASPWIPGVVDNFAINTTFDAQASLITTNSTEIKNTKDSLTVTNAAITKMQGDLNLTNAEVAKKASQAALDSLTGLVSDEQGKLTATTNKLLRLEATVGNTVSGLAISANQDLTNDFTYWRNTGEVVKLQSNLGYGNQIIKIGNNNGNDNVWMHNAIFMPFDPNIYYKVRAKLRRVTGSGTVYVGVSCKNIDKASYVTTSNTLAADMGSSVYLLSAAAPTLGVWQEYEWYIKGRAAGAAVIGSASMAAPCQLPNQAAWISPMLIANYTAAAGEVEVAYVTLESAEQYQTMFGNAQAIATTNATVTQQGKDIKSAADDIVTLKSRMQSAEDGLLLKADSSALVTTNAEVSRIDGVVKSQGQQLVDLSASLTNTTDMSRWAAELVRLQSQGKALRDDPMFKVSNNLAAYGAQTGATYTRQAKSADNPTNSTHELLIRSTAALGSGWLPGSPNLLGGPNKVYLIKQIVKIPVGLRLWPYGNPLGTGGYIRMLGNNEGTGKFETYYSVVQCGPDATATLQGHFRPINSLTATPPVASTTNPVDVIVASYEVWDCTTVNDGIPKEWADKVTSTANAQSVLEGKVTDQGGVITSQGLALNKLQNDLTTTNGELNKEVTARADAITGVMSEVKKVDDKVTINSNSITQIGGRLTTVEGNASTALINAATAQQTADTAVSAAGTNATAINTVNTKFNALPNIGVNLLDAAITNPQSKPVFTAGHPYTVDKSYETPDMGRYAITPTAASNSGVYFNTGGQAPLRLTLPEGKYLFSFYAKFTGTPTTFPTDWVMYGVNGTAIRFNITKNLVRYSMVFDVPVGGRTFCPLSMTNPTAVAASQNVVVYFERLMVERVTSESAVPSAWVEGSSRSMAEIAQSEARVTTAINAVSDAQGSTASKLDTLIATYNATLAPGKNILKGSNVEKVRANGAYLIGGYPIGYALTPGKTYTLVYCSTHVRASGDTSSVVDAWVDSSQNISIQNYGGDRVIKAKTFTCANGANAKTSINFYCFPSGTAAGTQSTVHWAVLMEGTTQGTADWFQSPYDVEQLVLTAEGKITALQKVVTDNQTANTTRMDNMDTVIDTNNRNLGGRITTLNDSFTSFKDTTNISLTQLSGRMTDAETGLNTSNIAQGQLKGRIEVAEGKITNNSSALTVVQASIGTMNDSSVLDYEMKVPEQWISHYGYDMKQYFKTTTTGKVSNTVFRKDSTNPVNCFNYNLSNLANDRAYKVTCWMRRSTDSSGSYGFPIMFGRKGVWSAANYTTLPISAAELPADGNWYLVSKVVNKTASSDTNDQIRIGIALGHTTAAGWSEAQAFKVTPILNSGDVDSSLATAIALNTLSADVKKVDDRVTVVANSVTQLKSEIIVPNNNLLRNSNFASDLTSWNAWGLSNAVRTIEVINGKKWLHIVANNTVTFRGIQQATLANSFKRKTVYTISFNAFSVQETGAITLLLHQSGGGNNDPQISAVIPITNVNKRYSYTFISADLDTKSAFNFMIGPQNGVAGDLYITDIMFGEGNVAAGWNASADETNASLAANAQAITDTRTFAESVDGRVTTVANTVTTLSSAVGDNTAALQLQGGVIDGIKAEYFVKTDVNGLVAGFGILNSGSTSAFAVNADYFYIGKPTNNKKPFIVITSPQTINGVTYPAGTWIDVAMIASATIGTAHIADAAITNAKIANLDASKITTGILNAARIRVGSTSSFDAGYDPAANLETAKNYTDITPVSGGKIFHTPAVYREAGSFNNYMVIKTPIIMNNQMTLLKLYGYNYIGGLGASFTLDIAFYAYQASNAFINNRVRADGIDITGVTLALDAAGKVVIIIQKASNWTYPQMTLETAILTAAVPPDSYKNGFSIVREADVSAYTNKRVVGIDTVETEAGAQAKAQVVQAQVTEFSTDGILSSPEKKQLRTIWDEILKEKPVMVASASSVSVSSTAFATAHDNLNAYLNPLLANLNANSTITRGSMQALFAIYYDEKAKLNKAIGDAIKAIGDLAQSTANTKSRTFITQPTVPYASGDIWKSGTSTFVSTVTRSTGSFTAADWTKVGDVTSENTALDVTNVNGVSAATVATNAATGKALSDNIMSDLIITPVEKSGLLNEWNRIKAEYANIVAQGTVTGVSTATLTTNYNALNSVVPRIELDVLANMTTNYVMTAANRDAFKAKLKLYFDTAESVAKDITNKVSGVATSKSMTYLTQPLAPYAAGDIWKSGTSTYICITGRASGSFVASDWVKVGDVTSENTAANSNQLGGTAASVINQNIANADSKAAAAQETANNIAVGARNYALASKTGNTNKNVSSEFKLKEHADQFVTVSFDINITAAVSAGSRNRIGFEFSYVTATNQTVYVGAWLNNAAANGVWSGRVTNTIKLPVSPSTTDLTVLPFYNQTSGGAFTISNVKLEYGNKPTDWTPAPEDVDTGIQTAQQAASDAATAAGNKGEVIFGSTAPVAAKQLAQNLWIDTTGNVNTPKRWNGSAWVAVTDKAATDAKAAADVAAAAAKTADDKAVVAQNAANQANNQVNMWKFTGTTEIDGGKIRADTITAVQLNVSELSAISGNLGTMITYVDPSKPTGERMVIQGTAIKVYDGSNVERIFIGIR